MIRRPAALLLGICLAGLAGPRLASAAPPQTQPAVTPAAPSPPAARTPEPVPAPAAPAAVTAPIPGRSTATPAARPVPAAPAGHAPVSSAAGAPASPTAADREPWEVPVGADLAAPAGSRGGTDADRRGVPPGLPQGTTLVLLALGILAFGCATGLTVLAGHAVVTPPDDAATLAAATRRRLREAPILPWDDPVLARMDLDRSRADAAAPNATGGRQDGRPGGPPRIRGGSRPGSRS